MHTLPLLVNRVIANPQFARSIHAVADTVSKTTVLTGIMPLDKNFFRRRYQARRHRLHQAQRQICRNALAICLLVGVCCEVRRAAK